MNKLWRDIIVASIIIVVAAVIVWNYYDITIFTNWVKIYNEIGLLNLYTMYRYNESYRVVYFPLAPLTFIAFYNLGETTVETLINTTGVSANSTQLEVITTTILRIISKIPLILSVYLTAYILYKKEGPDVTRWWFYSIPLIIAVATYQFDPLMILFLLAGSYWLVEKRWLRAGIAWGLGTAIKYVPIILVPVAFMASEKKRDFIKFLAAFTGVVLAVTLPFLIIDPEGFYMNVFEFHSDRPPQYLSIFNVPVLLSNRDPVITHVMTQIWPYVFIAIYIVVLLIIKPKPGDKDSIFISILALLLVFTIFNKVINPNYLLWSYPYIIYVLVKRRKKLGLNLLIVASIIAMLWPGLYLYVPAILNKPTYIEEEMRYYNARLLVERSFQGSGKVFLQLLFIIGGFFKPILTVMYDNINILGVIMILTYFLSLMYIAVHEIGEVKDKDDLKRVIRQMYTRICNILSYLTRTVRHYLGTNK